MTDIRSVSLESVLAENTALKREIARLTAENAALRSRVAKLEKPSDER